jgi:hypothetical protein
MMRADEPAGGRCSCPCLSAVASLGEGFLHLSVNVQCSAPSPTTSSSSNLQAAAGRVNSTKAFERQLTGDKPVDNLSELPE